MGLKWALRKAVAIVTYLLFCGQLSFSFTVDKNLPKLILISMDGFQWDYLDRLPANKTQNFHYFIERGVKAKWVNTVFPSFTYPVHYSMITGLYPESHGMVHNRFYDPDIGAYFHFADMLDNFYWKWYDMGAEPIYVTNTNAGQGRKSGSVLWPAGLARVKCVAPDRLVHHENSWLYMPNRDRVDTLISWFTDEEDPINLGLLYFLEPDETGHKYGTNSPEVDDIITGELNGVLGYLKERLEEHDLLESVNIILTADHGMVNMNNSVNIDEYVHPSWYHTGSKDDSNSLILQLWPTEGNEQRLLEGLKNVPNINVYQKGGQELRDLHFNSNSRIAPIILEPHEHFYILTNKSKGYSSDKGMHGYDGRRIPNINPFFIASGPAFKKGVVSGPLDMVDIYPLMCHALGITPAPNNGTLEHVKDMLSHPPHVNGAVNRCWHKVITVVLLFTVLF